MRKKLLIVLLTPFVYISYGQKYIEIAKQARQDYPEEVAVLNESTLDVSFQKRGDQFVAIEKRKEEFVCIQGEADFGYVVFYDENSKVTKFKSDLGRIIDAKYTDQSFFEANGRMKYVHFKSVPYGKENFIDVNKTHTDLRYFTVVNVASIYPCNKRIIKLIIPRAFEVEFMEKNFDGYHIQKEVEEREKSIIYTYVANKIPGYKKEDHAPGFTFTAPHILVLVKKYNNGKEHHTFFESLNDMYGWYHSLVLQMENKPDVFANLVQEVTALKTSEREKIEALYYWVQDNIRYIAFEDGIAGFKPENCQKVFTDRYGDCKGMANLLKEMLLQIGVDARLAWLGTKKVAYSYDTPTLMADNHMICAIKQGGSYQFLDPTEKYLSVGEYAERIQGRQVLVEDGEQFELLQVPNKESEQNKWVAQLHLELNDELQLKGEMMQQFNGEAKSTFIYYYRNIESNYTEELVENVLSLNNDHVKVTDLNWEGITQYDDQTQVSGKVQIDHAVSAFDQEIYLFVDPFKIFEDASFDEDRKYDYWFNFKRSDEVQIEITIPANFKITSLPENFTIKQSEFEMEVAFSQTDKTLKYNLKVEIPTAQISKGSMEQWNAAISKLNELYEQPVTLKKI